MLLYKHIVAYIFENRSNNLFRASIFKVNCPHFEHLRSLDFLGGGLFVLIIQTEPSLGCVFTKILV